MQPFSTSYILTLKPVSNIYIYPKNEIIDNAIRFNFSVQPDNVGRLFYAINGTNTPETLPEPEIISFDCADFFVMKWGVI